MEEVNKLGKILIVDDNEDVLFALNLLLEPYTEKIKVATTPDRIEHFMTTFQPDLILLDMNFSRDAISGQEGFESLKQILKIDPQAIVIFMTAYADTDKAVRAIKAGATDFIPKPWEKEKLLATLTSGMRLRHSQREVNILKEQVELLSGQNSSEGDIIGESPAMQEVFTTINKLSSTDANILILGENGTGKDVIARLLYRCSPRYGKPFVTIDLGSIPEQLFESELFGFEKGAFTDAKKSKAGRMEVATNGTLFLDEIGNLSLPMQSKLLTAIEKRQINRLGSTQAVPIDVRLICATNADIRQLVDEGNFRQDLLYRINTIEIHIPPLRERGNDIILLAEYFLQRYARKYKKDMRGLTREAKNKLLKYAWPGNVRELQHTIERAVILGDGSLLKPENFLFHASPKQRKEEEMILNLEQLERQTIEKAMKLSEGNISRAAEYLGITRFALFIMLLSIGSCLLFQKQLWFSTVICIILLITFGIHLYRMQFKQIILLRRLTDGLRYNDMMQTFHPPFKNKIMNEWAKELSGSLKDFRGRLLAEEIKHQYYENLLNKVDTAVLVTDKAGHIEWMNQAAVTHLGQISQLPEALLRASAINDIPIIRIEQNSTVLEMAISCTKFVTQGKEQQIISLKNIHSVLERNEMEAWQKLIRVLTHEIMNSITPIISLSETLSERGIPKLLGEKEYSIMLQAMQTIHRRSKGLLEFVENYRRLTRIPTPVCTKVSITELCMDLKKLFPEEYIHFEIPSSDLTLYIDRAQIEQVLINLLKNAREACGRQSDKDIRVEVIISPAGNKLLTVSDNGEGILPDVLDKIFVPFFTTKTSGSGIGLSLCKQIMTLHEGSINVKSESGKGSKFILTFPK